MDLTWAAFMMRADGHIYGRYGGRDAKSADSRNTLAGLRYALEAALAEHGSAVPSPVVIDDHPLIIDKTPSYAAYAKQGCIHCHQAKEILRLEANRKGKWDPASRWVYPLPENIGITLDLDRGGRVKEVAAASPAEKVGLRAGDTLVRLNTRPVHSFADAQHALHGAPARGAVPVTWSRDGAEHKGELELADGWKKTNITWRPSLMDLLPSLPLFGSDLSAADKKSLGLAPGRLAFRQESPLPPSGKALGVREGDIIVGIDGLALDLSAEQFLAYVRRNYLLGDRVTLNVVRGGKTLDLPCKLP
jgi:S1-C subfamily serine protease